MFHTGFLGSCCPSYTTRHISAGSTVYRVCLASPTCLLSSRGWLLCFSGIDCNLSLFNPFSGSVIELPPVPQCYSIGITPVISYDKFILSADPATTSDYAVAVIFSDPYLYFPYSEYKVLIWWNGDTNWVRVADRITNSVFRHFFHDLAFYKGELYGVDGSGQVACLGSSKSGEEIPRILANVRFCVNDWRVDASMYYLVDSEVDDRFLVIYRCINVLYVKDYVEVVNPLDGTRFVFEKTNKEDKDVNTQFFRVFEVDVKTGEVEQIHSLGNRAVFLGMNSSFSVEAAPAHGCKPNCIYSTDSHVSIYDFRYLNKGQDVGIYNFTDNKFEVYHYHGFSYSTDVATPPMWVQPPI